MGPHEEMLLLGGLTTVCSRAISLCSGFCAAAVLQGAMVSSLLPRVDKRT